LGTARLERLLSAALRTWVCGLGLVTFFASFSATDAPVYVIPVRGEIEPSLVYLVRRGIRQAVQAHAQALVLELDTPGGRADAMEEILLALKSFPKSEATYSFVHPKALSAGAFLAAGTRHIYMAPGSIIGAATPVLVGPGGGLPEALPESYEKKIASAYEALIRATAEANGHDPRVFAAMVDRELGLVVDGIEILPKGRVLTLTNTEAERKIGHPPRPLLSEGTMPSLKALIEKIAGPLSPVVYVRPTGFERLARTLALAGPLLLTLGLLLGYLELKLPGTWLFGLGSLLCFLLYFFGHYLAGLAGWEPIALFFFGLFLLAFEAVLAPGLLLPSLVGLFAIAFAVLLAAAGGLPGRSGPESARSWTEAALELLGSILFSLLLFLGIVRFLPHRPWARGLEQGTVRGAGEAPEQGALPGTGDLGVAWTVLRPSGQARFGDRLVDVVTEGVFIAKGTPVRVAKVEGSKVVVEPALPEDDLGKGEGRG
jgi:membrane-bound serine protease (ClpP class)